MEKLQTCITFPFQIFPIYQWHKILFIWPPSFQSFPLFEPEVMRLNNLSCQHSSPLSSPHQSSTRHSTNIWEPQLNGGNGDKSQDNVNPKCHQQWCHMTSSWDPHLSLNIHKTGVRILGHAWVFRLLKMLISPSRQTENLNAPFASQYLWNNDHKPWNSIYNAPVVLKRLPRDVAKEIYKMHQYTLHCLCKGGDYCERLLLSLWKLMVFFALSLTQETTKL